ncbi:MAG: N-acetylmuramic acid 6-phosphate etherase [Anaerorhabdus sp.]
MIKIDGLVTESNNERTKNIDQLSTGDMVKLINSEDKRVAEAVGEESEAIAKAIDGVAERFSQGGRIIYSGAGSSGRMGTLDAVELTPTYSVPPTRAFGLLAGGEKAMYVAVEGAEDSKELGIKDLVNINLTEKDIVIAIAASGRTPYAIGALEYGNKIGALTISITCNKESEMAKIANISIAPIVGPEVITGSTRMKAGTAQKMVVNMISTGAMIKIGKVYQNYMVHVQPTNEKLVIRSIGIVANITGISKEEAKNLFELSGHNVAVAIVMHEASVNKEEAEEALAKTDGKVRDAITSIKK